MGREIKRVAMDFDWPMHKKWEGYLNPFYRKCPECMDGSGQTEAMKFLEEVVGELMWKRGIPGLDELTTGLAGRPPSSPFGHYSLDKWSATKKVVAAAGLPKDWGKCPHCHGEGTDPAFKEKYEAWTPTEPSEGDGWQMWETTSEGSPISPVFASPDALARWLADSKASTFGDATATYDEWLGMINNGSAVDLVIENGEMKSGVEAGV
jgi:hypothetical protein